MADLTLRTSFCDLLDIEYPIVLAGMGGAASPELVAAVSNAGGLGILGAATLQPDKLAEWITRTRELTSAPFGVDTLLPMTVPRSGGGEKMRQAIPAAYREFAEAFRTRHGLPPSETRPPVFTRDFAKRQIEVILDMRVPVYVSGLGDPGFMVEQAHQLGIKVGAVVGATRHARKVMPSQLDFIVAQGHDAGGHNSRIGTMALIPQVVDVVRPLPVLGAGAITDGRGLVAALVLGAVGVWCGTVFLATEEANITPAQKQAILESNEDNTVVSRSRTGKPARMIKNLWVQEFEASGLEPLPMPLQGIVSNSVMEAARKAGRKDINPGFAGQGIGMITRIRPAAEILRQMVTEAHALLSGGLLSHIQLQ
jgi:NAD(P)H-dependent flavin oxidoreductase YrpB (nitropropane dioxygenase family)